MELARGGKHTKPLPEGPIALMLPGIMGSHLALESDRIWFAPINMIAGEMARLKVDVVGVTPAGWLDLSYENFAQHLAQSHEVRPFAYDWRLSIVDVAEKFGQVLDDAMKDAQQRKKPLRIVAHSMGGLVARLAMQSRWDRFKAIPGSRLVQFGTPNNGSHSIAAVLMGRDAFVQKIERWFDWKHDMREFLDIVRDFPGVLELLPWPLKDGVAGDGLDYFDAQVWQTWAAQDAENRDRKDRGTDMKFERAKGAGDGWPVPPAQRLLDAKAAIERVRAAPLDPDCTLYVAGSEKTPVAIRVNNAGQVEIGWTDRGDGRVPWDTGIPPGVKVWYVDAAHGDLLKHEEAFAEYVTLLETGTCRLSSVQSGTRDAGGVNFTPAPLAVHTLYPSAEEVMAAAVGGRAPRKRAKALSLPTAIEVVHGSLAGAYTPVLIGAYAHDPIGGSASFLDQHLGGSLKRAQKMGRYPAQAGEAMVFRPARPRDKPGGAIVVGLGALGELKPGVLSRALAHGFMEYARLWAETNPSTAPAKDEKSRAVDLSTVLVGTGYAGLSVELGMRAMAEALHRANQSLAQAGMGLRIGTLCVFEEEESRAIAAANALRELARDGKYAGVLSYDGRIRLTRGRYRGRCADQGGANGWQRVHITAGKGGGLRFTLLTDRARNEVDDEPDQCQAVDGLIRASTTTALDQPGLSRALFELMVPNGFKEALPDLCGLIIGVDAVAAAYPWELMRDEAQRYEQPLVTRIGVVRQLASPHGRKGVATVEEQRVLVVGDTQSGFVELPGAQQEGRMVAGLFQERGYEVNPLIRPDGQTVLVNLFDGHYRVIHLAAHGTLARNEKDEKDAKPVTDVQRYTGMVLGPNTILTTAQVSKLRRVPELVFINCCHLGSMAADARPRWGELAANLATEFIEMGCKAVIAAGWAVDDSAADTFAGAFYRAMLDGKKFGDAVLAARAETWRRHPGSNTWGAYQAYGDERYRLIEKAQDAGAAPDFLHAGQLSGELERLQARIGPANADERASYGKQLEKLESAARARFFHLAEIRERLAAAWDGLGDRERAIAHYRAALAQEDATSSLHALEQLANLEIRLGAKRMEKPESREEGEQLMQAGLQRLQMLLTLGETVERLSLLGSYWKRRADALHQGKAKIGEVRAALEEMLAAYRKASDLSLQTTGERDYYPTLNTLDGAFLLAALGNRKPLEALAPQRADWLAAAARNGNRR
ncbi:MAG: CHAT domain-containing protein, partial [Gammaproteobacteria bacterium]|nr:CHAT domain-containing protein [Gammaproteobacteria bacterium]